MQHVKQDMDSCWTVLHVWDMVSVSRTISNNLKIWYICQVFFVLSRSDSSWMFVTIAHVDIVSLRCSLNGDGLPLNIHWQTDVCVHINPFMPRYGKSRSKNIGHSNLWPGSKELSYILFGKNLFNTCGDIQVRLLSDVQCLSNVGLSAVYALHIHNSSLFTLGKVYLFYM